MSKSITTYFKKLDSANLSMSHEKTLQRNDRIVSIVLGEQEEAELAKLAACSVFAFAWRSRLLEQAASDVALHTTLVVDCLCVGSAIAAEFLQQTICEQLTHQQVHFLLQSINQLADSERLSKIQSLTQSETLTFGKQERVGENEMRYEIEQRFESGCQQGPAVFSFRAINYPTQTQYTPTQSHHARAHRS